MYLGFEKNFKCNIILPFYMFIPRAECFNETLSEDEVMYTTLFTTGLLSFFAHAMCTNDDMLISL